MKQAVFVAEGNWLSLPTEEKHEDISVYCGCHKSQWEGLYHKLVCRIKAHTKGCWEVRPESLSYRHCEKVKYLYLNKRLSNYISLVMVESKMYKNILTHWRAWGHCTKESATIEILTLQNASRKIFRKCLFTYLRRRWTFLAFILIFYNYLLSLFDGIIKR